MSEKRSWDELDRLKKLSEKAMEFNVLPLPTKLK